MFAKPHGRLSRAVCSIRRGGSVSLLNQQSVRFRRNRMTYMTRSIFSCTPALILEGARSSPKTPITIAKTLPARLILGRVYVASTRRPIRRRLPGRSPRRLVLRSLHQKRSPRVMLQQARLLLSKALSSCSVVLSGFSSSPGAEVGYQGSVRRSIKQASINFEV
jgi:hypothetical protein